MSRPQGPIATGRIMLMENFNDTIGNPTRGQARRSAMPQPPVLPRALHIWQTKSNKLRKPYTCYECQIFPKPAGMLSNEMKHWNVGRLSSQHNVGNKKVYQREQKFGSRRSKRAWSTQQIVRFVVFVQLQSEHAFGKFNGLVHTWWRRCHMKHTQRDN